MQTSRLVFYTLIALFALLTAYFILVKEPPLYRPINLVHLFARH